MWLNGIRDVVSDRVTIEEDRVPTSTLLWRHWLRCCWLSQMWQNSGMSPQNSGWLVQEDGKYVFDWEATEV